MPSSSLQLALIALWVAKPSLLWLNETWQSLTGITGEPWDYDSDADLEARATIVEEWTVSQAKTVKEFMVSCKEISGTDECHVDSQGNSHSEGRKLWNSWIKAHWCKTWKVNTIIDQVFDLESCSPHTVLARHMISDPAQLPTLKEAQVEAAVSKHLAFAMFGDEAFVSGDFLDTAIATFISVVIALTWNRYRKTLKRQKSDMGKKAKDMEDMWNKMISTGAHPTMAILRGYIRRVESYIKILSLFKDEESLRKMDERRGLLTTMLEATTRNPGIVGDVQRLPKVLRDALNKLATETEVRELEAIIQAALDAMASSDAVHLDFEETIPLADWRSGVEEYAECSMDDLWQQLGLDQSKQLPFFQTYTDPNDVISPWSEDGQAWLDDALNEKSILAPRWHQLVGILRMIDRALLGEPVMLMDGVGIGKTMQAVGVIACLAHYHDYYKMHGMFPGKFASRRCAKTGGNLPDLPTVVICPPNLQHQWTSEIERYLRRATFDILPYVGKYANRKDWWRKAWDQCRQPLRRRVVLATTLAIQEDATMIFGDGPREDPGCPQKTARYDRIHGNTIYGQHFSMLVADEAHVARKYNKVHLAFRGLLERCMVMIAMTATPVTTRPADLWLMAQVLGLPNFQDNETYRMMNKELASAQRKDRKAQKEAGVGGSILRGLLVGATNPDRPRDEYGPVMKKWMGQMREWFAPAIILRTPDSVDNAGTKILGLPPCHDHTLRMHLLPWEMNNLRDIAKGYLEDSPVVGIGAASRNFYIEFRRAVLHPHMNPSEDRPWVKPTSLEAWENSPHKSVKLDVLGRLVSYHLMQDGRPPMEMDESGHTLTANPMFEASGSIADDTHPDRIVVYSAFPSSNRAIFDILDLHDVLAVELNGKTPMNKRNAVLGEFRSSTRKSGPRVLILSGVGMVGLNLACANIMVVMDTLWSEQDDRQLRGRIYRHPQNKPVHIYRAIALRTADVFLNNISFSKGAMHEAFIGTDQEIRLLFENDNTACYDLLPVAGDSNSDVCDEKEMNGTLDTPGTRQSQEDMSVTLKAQLSPKTHRRKRRSRGSVGVEGGYGQAESMPEVRKRRKCAEKSASTGKRAHTSGNADLS
ncbi:P-loop containing nucleoside triphosphate hydrolase protein [Suillus occidentalis]|nr:P-loop containing nucleoside triphosphate hydrolase protein [Suillus occidentalis]